MTEPTQEMTLHKAVLTLEKVACRIEWMGTKPLIGRQGAAQTQLLWLNIWGIDAKARSEWWQMLANSRSATGPELRTGQRILSALRGEPSTLPAGQYLNDQAVKKITVEQARNLVYQEWTTYKPALLTAAIAELETIIDTLKRSTVEQKQSVLPSPIRTEIDKAVADRLNASQNSNGDNSGTHEADHERRLNTRVVEHEAIERSNLSPVPWKNPSLAALFRIDHSTAQNFFPEILPEWDLSSLYQEPAAPKITEDLDALDFKCKEFERNYKDRLGDIGAYGLLRSILAYENIEETAGRIMSYLGLHHFMDKSNEPNATALYQAQVRITEITARLIFFHIEVGRIEESTLESMYFQSPELSQYRTLIDQIKVWRKFQLPETEEQSIYFGLLNSTRLNVRFEEVMAGIQVDVLFGNVARPLRIEDALWIGGEGSDNRELRKEARIKLGQALAEKNQEITTIYSSLISERSRIGRLRGFQKPTTSLHLADRTNPKTVDVMESSIRRWVPRIVHRYYQLKMGWLGLDRLYYWDVRAPLPFESKGFLEWRDASNIVHQAINDFSPTFGSIAADFLTRGWIDARPRAGKDRGDFCHPTVSGANPFISINFFQGERDALSLASMLGHGIHQYLASARGELLSAAPLTLASTASQFFETLVATRLLESAQSDLVRRRMLAGMVEQRLIAYVRQMFLYRFEMFAHSSEFEGRKRSPEELNGAWLEMEKDYYGPCFEPFDGAQYYWSRISHLFHSPLQSYSYSFGGLVATALFAEFLEDIDSGKNDFSNKLQIFLSAGRTKAPEELIGLFGLDIMRPSFWDGGLSVLSKMVDELEVL